MLVQPSRTVADRRRARHRRSACPRDDSARRRRQRYIGAGPFYWLTDIARALREGAPWIAKRLPCYTLPSWLVRLAGRFDPAGRDRLFELDKKRAVSADKARAELGWRPRSNDEAIVAAAESLRAEGLVKA